MAKSSDQAGEKINLQTPTGRKELAPRRNPYFVTLRPGLALGYRSSEDGEGTWIARRLKEGTKEYEFRSLGDLADFDAKKERYARAALEAESWAAGMDKGMENDRVTIKQVCENWVKFKKVNNSKASASDVEGRFKRLVYESKLGAIYLDKLKTTDVRKWLHDQLNEDGDEEELRRSKNSANRNLAELKAALNRSLSEHLVMSDAGWKTVMPFKKASKSRTGDLTPKDRKKLIAACEADLAALVKALLLTAVRPGEIASAKVEDFNPEAGSLKLSGKTGSRTVTLSTAAVEFFKEQAKDCLPSAYLLRDQYGNQWNKDSWKKRFKKAVEAAGLPDNVVMYTLRHVAISDMIAGGMDSFLVGRLAGTSTAMIDKTYGHLRHTQTRAMLDAVAML